MKVSKEKCPGCHGDEFRWIYDGFGDGDRWFYCYRCGYEKCVDNEEAHAFAHPVGPPVKKPPYKNEDPLPREHIWPGAMSPRQIREWVKKREREGFLASLLRDIRDLFS